jgi:hypothetical protein
MVAAVTAAVDHPLGVAEFLAGIAKLVVRDRVDDHSLVENFRDWVDSSSAMQRLSPRELRMSQLERKPMVNAVSRRGPICGAR